MEPVPPRLGLLRWVPTIESIRLGVIREGVAMAAESKTRTYHATMLITRAEEWCVEAASPEEARALLAAGEGHRCHPGECLHAEIEELLDQPA
jgi:hypothetical protein